MPRPAKIAPPELIPATIPPSSAPQNLFAGTSGWAYPTWKPDFYPANVPAKHFLASYATRLNSVEVNYTFRSLPTEKILSNWLESVPENFRFSFKAPQRITHIRRLRDSAADLDQFLKSIEPAHTAGKVGLVLFQLPPNFKADYERLGAFLESLPANTPPVAFEFRNESWFAEETYTLLRQHNAALCIAESDELKTPEVHTAQHTCFRLRCAGGYKPNELASFAQRFTELAKERTVYAYFKHEDEPTGALNATEMLWLAGRQELQ